MNRRALAVTLALAFALGACGGSTTDDTDTTTDGSGPTVTDTTEPPLPTALPGGCTLEPGEKPAQDFTLSYADSLFDYDAGRSDDPPLIEMLSLAQECRNRSFYQLVEQPQSYPLTLTGTCPSEAGLPIAGIRPLVFIYGADPSELEGFASEVESGSDFLGSEGPPHLMAIDPNAGYGIDPGPLVNDINARVGRFGAATGPASPVHVFLAQPVHKYGPGNDPAPLGVEPDTAGMYPEYSAPQEESKGVAVVDVGRSRQRSPEGIDFLSGHGPFVASVADRATNAYVGFFDVADHYGSVTNTLKAILLEYQNAPGGLPAEFVDLQTALNDHAIWNPDELSIAKALLAAGDEAEWSVLNLSLGSYSCEEPPAPPQAITSVLDTLHDEGLIGYVTAAGGNDASQRAFFPAALGASGQWEQDRPWIVGVGALDRAGSGQAWETARLAEFSNSGVSVQACMPGVDVYGRLERDDHFVYVTGTDTEVVEAVWSGTSFAAPLMAAYLASGAALPPAGKLYCPEGS